MPDNNAAANEIKIFPRNLTARAEHVVRGNPASSRPESGVQNCFPGLELDLRNIEQVFLGGMVFEFHRNDGAMLVRVDEPITGITNKELEDRPLYLWAMYGRSKPEEEIAQAPLSLWGFQGQGGLDVWAKVHDLLPGRVAVLLGPTPGFSNTIDRRVASPLLQAAYDAGEQAGEANVEQTIRRDSDNQIEYMVVSQHRAEYVDADGVLAPDLFPPGELTKSLCAPWIYDFRDCVCFYWASNKPDIVDSEDGKTSFVNYLRQTEDRTDSPPQDVKTYGGRRNLELNYREMINGWWEQLPVVLNDRESTAFSVTPTPTFEEYLTRDQVIAELTYLATVEHALIIEYLYAVYSTKASRLRPESDADEDTRTIFAAANEVFHVAIDEMRHFRWVNEVLKLMGAPPSVDRATVIGKPPTKDSGRKMNMSEKFIERPFSLNPLTRETQQWFINVEAPSQVANQDLDGMYVAILESINFQPELFPQRAKILPIIKLIIDEGEGHYERFTGIKESLDAFEEFAYLRDLKTSPVSPRQQKLLDVCDAYYHSIEEVIQITFSIGDRSGGLLVKAAVRSMENLHEASHLLASQGVLPQFNRPSAPPSNKRFSNRDSLAMLQAREATIVDSLKALDAVGSEDEKSLAQSHLAKSAALYGRLQEIVRNDEAD